MNLVPAVGNFPENIEHQDNAVKNDAAAVGKLRFAAKLPVSAVVDHWKPFEDFVTAVGNRGSAIENRVPAVGKNGSAVMTGSPAVPEDCSAVGHPARAIGLAVEANETRHHPIPEGCQPLAGGQRSDSPGTGLGHEFDPRGIAAGLASRRDAIPGNRVSGGVGATAPGSGIERPVSRIP